MLKQQNRSPTLLFSASEQGIQMAPQAICRKDLMIYCIRQLTQQLPIITQVWRMHIQYFFPNYNVYFL